MKYLVLIAAIFQAGCASIITKSQVSGVENSDLRCEPIALTVYHRSDKPGAISRRDSVTYSSSWDLVRLVLEERRKNSCHEAVDVRQPDTDSITFRELTLASGISMTPDEQFAAHLKKLFPPADKPWLQISYGSDFKEEPVFLWLIHVVSLGLIPFWSNEDYTYEIKVVNPRGKMHTQAVASYGRVWTWSPFVFRSDSQDTFTSRREIQVLPLRMLINPPRSTP